MVSLELVLSFLAAAGIRATYEAVADATGIFKRSLRNEIPFVDRDPRTAWVVYSTTGQPPPKHHSPRPRDSELIRDGDVLARRAAAHGRE